MKQKLGLACCLDLCARLLLLDEPSVGVDPISRRELWRLVYELVDQGIAVVWSTAYLDEAERCQSVLTLDQGRILYDGPPEELTARVAGRCYLVRGAERKRRACPSDSRPGCRGRGHPGPERPAGRQAGASPPAAETLGEPAAEVVPTPPRFEDAFVDLLGGGPRHDSPLAAGKQHFSRAARQSSRPKG